MVGTDMIDEKFTIYETCKFRNCEFPRDTSWDDGTISFSYFNQITDNTKSLTMYGIVMTYGIVTMYGIVTTYEILTIYEIVTIIHNLT